MINLIVEIEINGKNVYAGNISGHDITDACFSYAPSYLDQTQNPALSISLPLTSQPFDASRTQTFFEGLLPEGFTRKCVARWMHASENDYLTLLAGLGSECLGAIRITDAQNIPVSSGYQKLSASEVKKLAQEGATESAEFVTKAHLSLTGASGKAGLYYAEKENCWYLPMGNAPSTHIVKQSHIRLQQIVANEQLCLLTAQYLGIDVPESFIIQTDSSQEEDVLFATRRYDRKFSKNSIVIDDLPVPCRLHQEDFAQALGIPAVFKYEKGNAHYLQKMFALIRNYSSDPIADQQKLWNICIFNYLIGNTDNHMKNMSLLYGEDLKSLRLAPAYDIVSTSIYPNSAENMALSIGGKYTLHDITRTSFAEEAKSIGLGAKIAMKQFDTMVENFESALWKAHEELLLQKITGTESICEKILKSGAIQYYR